MVISIACTAVQKCFPKSSLELALSCSFVIQWHKLIPNRNANIFANLGTHQFFFFLEASLERGRPASANEMEDLTVTVAF